MYGSVTSADLADEIWRTRKIRIDRRKVRLDEPIKALGDYLVEIDLFPEVKASLRVSVAQAEGFDATATAVDAEPAAPAAAAVAAE
jgi:large subunit ribosomal protein L9